MGSKARGVNALRQSVDAVHTGLCSSARSDEGRRSASRSPAGAKPHVVRRTVLQREAPEPAVVIPGLTRNRRNRRLAP